jgi:NAD(P)-dependent dehydrogenase (short-subunit alcohol dehydrogenase family)
VPDQTGRTVLVTGANSGLGFWTSLELAQRGARVLMACRDPQRARAAHERLLAAAPGAHAELVSLDLASLDSVERAAADVASRTGALDVLVNNAGIMAVAQGQTQDGFELQLGTNHLGHFALTGRLLPLLLQGGCPRVVTVSSYAHRLGRLDLEDLMGTSRYGRWRAYAQSKLANLLFSSELQRRAGGRLTSVAAHPGYAATHLQHGQGQRHVQAAMRLGNRLLAQTDAQGAWPVLRAATDPDAVGDDYFGPHWFELRGHPVRTGRSRHALDLQLAARLWEASEDLTGVRYAL